MKFLLLIIWFAMFNSQSIADCITGYACSLTDLYNKEQAERNIEAENIIKEFFNKRINEEIFFSKLNEDTEYQDLFIFKKSVSIF